MTRFKPLIITASAGTGKTYRLALEYVRLLLDHFNLPDFSMDSILVLTFTRKATAEIKQRIQDHLRLLVSTHSQDRDERRELILELKYRQGDGELSPSEEGILTSVSMVLAADRRMLQVMTLDSYIHSIFRNIVKPLRSIGDFELDLQAVKKRMPFLLSDLMTPSRRAVVDSLLRRKVSPSLDAYEQFFTSLIDNRWLLYLLTRPVNPEGKATLRYHFLHPDPAYAQAAKDGLFQALDQILQTVSDRALAKQKDWEELFNADTRKLFASFPPDPESFLAELDPILERSSSAMALYKTIKELKLYNGNIIRANKPENSHLPKLLQEVRRQLANYLVHSYLLPEQAEIFSIWEAILGSYDHLIYRYKNMTYNDIAWFTLEALFKGEPPNFELSEENTANEFYQFLSHRSRYILIDEFQDTSLIQFAILKPIIEEVCAGHGSQDYGGLIVVGDEKQSIFGWRGGERELLLNLKQIFPTLKDIRQDRLDKSWRSSPLLMDFINSIFQDNGLKDYLAQRGMKWDYEPITSAVPEINHLSQLSFDCEKYQTMNVQRSLDEVRRQWIKDWVMPYCKADEEAGYSAKKPESIAILCRKGSELSQMQQLMDEFGITSVYQPNAELPEHHLIAPLLSYLKWLAWKDWLDWLAWLRSDYILLRPQALKLAVDTIWKAGQQKPPIAPDFKDQPLLHKFSQAELPMDSGVYAICQQLVDCYLDRGSLSERDQLNLDAFLSLTASFELDPSQTRKDLPAFLEYLEDLRGQDALKQVAIEGGDKVQLLTIHKSKGLQFDRVFVFYNLSGRHGNEGKKLDWYALFAGKDFNSISDFALSYHYGQLLEHSDYADLHTRQEQRALLEEMNNLYVAFTRAKTKLHILFTYRSTKEWSDYRNDQDTKDDKLPNLLCEACHRWFDGQREKLGQPKPGAPEPDKQGKQESDTPRLISCEASLLASALDFAPLPLAEPQQLDPAANRRQIWLEDRANLIGDLWHYYLSFIIRDLPEEHSHARRQVISHYCSILTLQRIDAELKKLRDRLRDFPLLFEPRWNKVFTELPIYQGAKELRVDRLMLDTLAKQALIIDYKTGGIYETEQLERYRSVLAQLPVLRDGAYSLEISYIQL